MFLDMSSIYKSQEGGRAIQAWYEGMLRRWPVPAESLAVPTRHGDTFVLACGKKDAPPLVMLHGAGSNSAMWFYEVSEYASRFRVYLVDLIGEPGKSAPSRPDWRGPAFAEWLEDVVSGLGLDRVSILGLSQGAWAAMKFATLHPQRVKRLVLLAPGGIIPDRISFLFRVLPLLVLGKGVRAVQNLVLAGQPVPEDLAEGMALMMTHFKPRIGALPLFSDEELRRISAPTLVIFGEKDALRNGSKVIARMKAHCSQLTSEILPDVGHAVIGAQPRCLKFLAGPA